MNADLCRMTGEHEWVRSNLTGTVCRWCGQHLRQPKATPCGCGHGWGSHRAGVVCFECDCTRFHA